MTSKKVTGPVTPEEVKNFIQNNLTYINRNAGEIEYTNKNGDNYEEGFHENVYEAINAAILRERKIKLVVY